MKKPAFCTILLVLGIFLAAALPAAAAPRYTCKELGTLPFPYNTGSTASGINAAGQVVGFSCGSSPGVSHAFLWSSGGGMVDLGTLKAPYDPWSEAWGINAAGKVVGDSLSSYGIYQAFLYNGGPLQNLSSPFGLYNSNAKAINALDQVVGVNLTIDGWHAFLYGSSGKDLGTLGGHQSNALGINGAGQVVGGADTTSSGYQHAYLYTAPVMYSDPVMLDLNNLVQNLPAGIILSEAAGINDRGQIIANGNYIDFYYGHTYLLTPITSVPALDLLLLQ